MPAPDHLAFFVLAAAALIVVPGPAVLFVVARTIVHGRRAGVVSASGVACGGLVHVAAATVGLSAILAASATAFTVVKLVGAAYLVVLGVRTLVGHRAAVSTLEAAQAEAEAPLAALFRQGVIVNILNPKTALFFLAFLPQFVDRHHAAAPQIALLGLIFVAMALLSDSLYATAAGALRGLLARSRRAERVERVVSGSVFIGLGLLAADAQAPASR